MSKNNKNNPQEAEIAKEMPLANPQGKTVEELKEIAQTLQVQFEDHKKQAAHHQTMMVKAQGALEVVIQLIPKEEMEKMIDQENKNENRENGEVVES